MKHACKNPGKIARAAKAHLQALGATVVEMVEHRRCLTVRWTYGGRAFATPCTRSSHGGNSFEMLQRMVRQQLRAAGLEAQRLAPST